MGCQNGRRIVASLLLVAASMLALTDAQYAGAVSAEPAPPYHYQLLPLPYQIRQIPRFCRYGYDQYGNCRLSAPYCPFGPDMYGNCREKEVRQCPYGADKLGRCRQEPAKYCPYGEDFEGNCHPQAQHCRFGFDQYGSCLMVPLTAVCHSCVQAKTFDVVTGIINQ